MGMPVNDMNALAQLQQGGWAAVQAQRLPVSYNMHAHSEDLGWVYWALIGGPGAATKTGGKKQCLVDGQVITLAEVTGTNPYAALLPVFNAAGWSKFVPGGHYLYSAYIYSPTEYWWCPRKQETLDAGGFGQGVVQCRAGHLTRVWVTIYANTNTEFDLGGTPTAALGAVNNAQPCLFSQTSNGPVPSIWVGGAMIEPAPSDYVDGVALIGDSTMQGSAGSTDVMRRFSVVDNREVSTVLGSELRVPVFNRAIGGNRLTGAGGMDARWSTDISVLKHRCHAVVIQGGINDIANSVPLSACQAAIQSMTAKAQADGFKRVYYLNCTPTESIRAVPAQEANRKALNAWLASTYGPAVCDISSIVTDSVSGDRLHSGAYGSDGIHYGGHAKTAVAAHIARTLDWSWRRTPSTYTPTLE